MVDNRKFDTFEVGFATVCGGKDDENEMEVVKFPSYPAHEDNYMENLVQSCKAYETQDQQLKTITVTQNKSKINNSKSN